MKRRVYGTGTLRELASGKWLLEYKPKWALKRLSKTVEAPNHKIAARLLSDWVTELDEQDGPHLTIPIDQLIELHLADMRTKARSAEYGSCRHASEEAPGEVFRAFRFFGPTEKSRREEVCGRADSGWSQACHGQP